MREPLSPPLTPELMARDIARLRAEEVLRAESTARPPLRVFDGPISDEPRPLPAIDREQVELDIGDAFWTGPAPSADELGCDVAGLQPARAELVRIEAWRARVAAEIVERGAWRMELEAKIAAPTKTEAALRELVAGEKTSLIARIKAGISPTADATPRTEERAQLEAQLLAERHDAEVAAAALQAVRHDVEVRKRRVEVLEDRRERALAAALREIAEPEARRSVMRLELIAERLAAHAEAFQADAAEWRAEYVKLHAIDRATGLQPRIELNVEPPPEVERIEINVHEAEIAQASAPWRDALQQLRQNPRAQLRLSEEEN